MGHMESKREYRVSILLTSINNQKLTYFFFNFGNKSSSSLILKA